MIEQPGRERLRWTIGGNLVLLLLSLLALNSGIAPVAAQSQAGVNIYAVTVSNKLVQFNSSTPGTITAQMPLTGLPVTEQIVGLDFRPATGQLVALANSNRLYTIDPTSGAASLLMRTQPFTSTVLGNNFGLDFNPVVDRIRLVSDTGSDLRLNPLTGGVAVVDAALAYAASDANAGKTPGVVAAAYTNNISGTTSTQLYVLDATQDLLVKQGTAGPPVVSPNSGQLFTVGSLGIDIGARAGFDISQSGVAYVSYAAGSATNSTLGSINLATGAITPIGEVATGEPLAAFAIPTSVTPGESVYAVTVSNKLLRFRSSTPGGVTSSLAISGLATGDQIVGLDFRPATGQLVALGSSNQLYTLDTTSGAATLLGTQPFTSTMLGGNFGFDYNPAVDRIRLVSDTGSNLRLNPNTGTIAAPDGALAYATGDANAGKTPGAVAAAYTNNISGTTSTQLYLLDATQDLLVKQGTAGPPVVSPNTGQLFTVGGLGVDIGPRAGFDISQAGAAYVSYATGSATNSSFGRIDLATGTITPIGDVTAGELIAAFAVTASAPPRGQLYLPIVVR